MIDLFPNGTVLIQWVIFMIALMTLNLGIFRPVLRVLRERDEKTAKERERAKSLEQRAQEMTLLYEKKMEEARGVGTIQRMEIRGLGDKTAEGILKKARAEADATIEEVRQTIERESREAGLQLRQYAQGLSHEIASKVLGRDV